LEPLYSGITRKYVTCMNTLVHEEKYRGDKLLKKIADCDLTFCGVGAIGSNLMDNMVRQGFKKITAIDFDRVDDHNRNTQLWGRRDIGQLKVAAMKSAVFNSMGVTITDVARKLEASNLTKYLKPGTLVIDGFDNPESRALVYEHCRGNHIDCLHVGLYKDVAEVTWNAVYRVPAAVKGLDVCEYPLARNVILMAITVATESIIRYLDTGAQESYFITLGDLKILPK
jgi:molybdopterin-synthase adenylyltransferase